MRAIILLASIIVIAPGMVSAAEKPFTPIHPVSTYSIVAYDTLTGEFGAAVQSHYFKVADVIWLEPVSAPSPPNLWSISPTVPWGWK